MNVEPNTNLVALNAGWTNNGTATCTNASATGVGSVTFYPYDSSYYDWYRQYTYPLPITNYIMSPAPRPIKLKMSEVERLRKAAKADTALRDILEKFTSQIEVEVDFK